LIWETVEFEMLTRHLSGNVKHLEMKVWSSGARIGAEDKMLSHQCREDIELDEIN
jgi:hypothetical protein